MEESSAAPEELLNRDVQIVGLVRAPRYNGRVGLAYAFDVEEGGDLHAHRCKREGESVIAAPASLGIVRAVGRYGVLTGGRHLAVKAANLRPAPAHTDTAGDPFRYDVVVRGCGACGVVGIVSSSPSLEEAGRHCAVVLHPCSSCREAVYCSRACQKKAWREHKPGCVGVKDARDLIGAFIEDPALNAMLCERADEEVDGMTRRRLIHFQCPRPETLRDLRDKGKLLKPGGVPVDIQYASGEDLVDVEAAGLKRNDEVAIWEAALEQTQVYDMDREIAIVVSAPVPDGAACVVMPAIVPRLFKVGEC